MKAPCSGQNLKERRHDAKPTIENALCIIVRNDVLSSGIVSYPKTKLKALLLPEILGPCRGESKGSSSPSYIALRLWLFTFDQQWMLFRSDGLHSNYPCLLCQTKFCWWIVTPLESSGNLKPHNECRFEKATGKNETLDQGSDMII